MADGLWESASAEGFSLPGDEKFEAPAPEPAPEPAVEVEAEAPAPEEAPVEETVEPEAERLYAGKYKSDAELERAYEEAQRELGRKNQELGELRSLQEQASYAPPMVDQDQVLSLVEENPIGAMTAALNSGDGNLIRRVAEEWDGLSPGAPHLFVQNYQLQQQMHAMQQSIEQRTQPLEQDRTNTEFAHAYQQVKAERPDIDDLSLKMKEIADANPEIIEALRVGDYESKVRVLSNLHDLARARSAGNLATAAKAAARGHVEETNRAKEEALLVSATASVSEAQPSPAEQIGAQWDEIDKPFKNGWNV